MARRAPRKNKHPPKPYVIFLFPRTLSTCGAILRGFDYANAEWTSVSPATCTGTSPSAIANCSTAGNPLTRPNKKRSRTVRTRRTSSATSMTSIHSKRVPPARKYCMYACATCGRISTRDALSYPTARGMSRNKDTKRRKIRVTLEPPTDANPERTSCASRIAPSVRPTIDIAPRGERDPSP